MQMQKQKKAHNMQTRMEEVTTNTQCAAIRGQVGVGARRKHHRNNGYTDDKSGHQYEAIGLLARLRLRHFSFSSSPASLQPWEPAGVITLNPQPIQRGLSVSVSLQLVSA